MKHQAGFKRLGRCAGHRRAMTRNILTSLFRHGRIKTTKAKAMAVRRTAEKMITRAKLDSVHNRRIIGKDIRDKAVLSSLFTEIGPRFKERPGGYTRVLKLGPRHSDAAEMVYLELLAEDETVESKPKKRSAAKKVDSSKAKSAVAPPEDSVAENGAEVSKEAVADTQAPAKGSAVAEEGASTADSETESDEEKKGE